LGTPAFLGRGDRDAEAQRYATPINIVKKRVMHWYQDEPRPQVSKEREIEYTTDLFNTWDRQDPAWLYAERLYS
jgi:hypothetical protein